MTHIFRVLMMCCLMVELVWAEDVKLNVLIEEALQNNPEILAAQQDENMALTRPSQVHARPDPMLQVEFQNIGLNGFSVGQKDMSMAGISFSQVFPYPGKRALRRTVAEKEAQQTGARIQVIRASVIMGVKTAYYDLDHIHHALDVVDRTRDVLKEFEIIAQARYAVGKGVQQDVWKAQVELSMLTEKQMMLEQMKEGLEAQLNRWLNRPIETFLGTPERIGESVNLPPLEDFVLLAREYNPELVAARNRIGIQEAQVALMQKEYKPDFAVSAGWRSRGGLEDLYQVMVDVELPVNRARRRQGVLEAQALVGSAQHMYRAIEETVLADVRETLAMARTSQKLSELYEHAIIPQATFSLSSAQAGYRVGQVDFLMVLDNIRTLLDSEFARHEKLVDYHKAVARLEAMIGTPLVVQDGKLRHGH